MHISATMGEVVLGPALAIPQGGCFLSFLPLPVQTYQHQLAPAQKPQHIHHLPQQWHGFPPGPTAFLEAGAELRLCRCPRDTLAMLASLLPHDNCSRNYKASWLRSYRLDSPVQQWLVFKHHLSPLPCLLQQKPHNFAAESMGSWGLKVCI